MAKSQTRKCISISGETYERVSAHCKERSSSISGFVEMLVAEFFRNETAPTPFICNGVKRESPQGTKKDPIRGGGVHSL